MHRLKELTRNAKGYLAKKLKITVSEVLVSTQAIGYWTFSTPCGNYAVSLITAMSSGGHSSGVCIESIHRHQRMNNDD